MKRMMQSSYASAIESETVNNTGKPKKEEQLNN
eukprot:CAMPEP_0176351590 /NCGR_PEP_ID=MMETSP0126-20121128/10342_1 /TAXON_ID=141414 ORGANISM="Strombidinopsis acuminatum, Strain SPMC142" /NCGR_SAMPLE_ID=MMETSP0126 /ASSEMBLY_ACC=CAM_ASM_000229 /LENGTH=32 /DNA_ID= /DNA_START= /DNA_END= /DNA_ORIENTATION=